MPRYIWEKILHGLHNLYKPWYNHLPMAWVDYVIGFPGGCGLSALAYHGVSRIPSDWTRDPYLPRAVEQVFMRTRDIGAVASIWIGVDFFYTFQRKDDLHFALDVAEGGLRGAIVIGACVGLAHQGKALETLAGCALGSIAGATGAFLGHFCRKIKNLL